MSNPPSPKTLHDVHIAALHCPVLYAYINAAMQQSYDEMPSTEAMLCGAVVVLADALK